MSMEIFEKRLSASGKDDLAFEMHLLLSPEKRRQIEQCSKDVENGDFVTEKEIFR